jgi:hypothetical protein
MNLNDIETVCTTAKALATILDEVSNEVATEAFSLVLAGRSNEEIITIINAGKARYTRITGKEIYEKIPKIKIQVTRA